MNVVVLMLLLRFDAVAHPATFSERVTVVGTDSERRATSVPGTLSIVPGAQLLSSPPVAIDDVLRSVPTFSLFRRSSSRVANPTAQGELARPGRVGGVASAGAGERPRAERSVRRLGVVESHSRDRGPLWTQDPAPLETRALAPVRTIGLPRTGRIGLRLLIHER